uniref:Uncharacterized protein n=1 Tax=Siphoviridae sp. ctmYS12 TaxID=2825652 RepID=A0A8S5P7F2_9CAUD|nr:MAG TPA: hypothetical protein [Siphoviridae sp. ctmYS12]
MIKALKKYKDEVLKPEIAWLKRYWIGFLVYLVICLIVEIVLTMVRNSKEEKHNEDNYYEDRYGKDEES